jgi:O-antigen ligase
MIKQGIQFITRHYQTILVGAMALFFFFAPFSVASLINKITPVPTSVLVSFLVASALIVLYVVGRVQGELGEPLLLQKKFILVSLFLLPIVSIFAALYNLQVIRSVEYIAYVKESLPTRVINLSFFFIIFYVFNNKMKVISDKRLLFIVNSYLVSIFIIALFGIWQLLYYTAGIAMIELETRSFVHSVDEDVLFNFRLTSFVDEPSYLVPLLIDSLIIGLIVLKNRIKTFLFIVGIPSLIVLVFSFSVSGFANLALILLFSLVVFITLHVKNKKKILVSTIIMVVGLILAGFFFRNYLIDFLMPIIGRFDTLLDIHKHSRLYQTVMPFFWLFDYSIVNAIFGFGPGSYEFLQMTKFLHYEVPISVTSNNMWVDLLFEYGIVGVSAFMATYLYILFSFFKRRNQNRYFLFSLILWFHLGVTSIYRSDFASPRFWVIVMTVWILYELGNRVANKKEIS